MQLTERYRPKCWCQVIGQQKITDKLERKARQGELSGRCYWLSGQSGTGKTSIARLIAREIADEFNICELDAGSLTVSELQEIERESQFKGMGERNGRCYIINEAHALRKPVIRQLLVMLERIPAHVAIVFTTTVEGQEQLFEDCDDSSPLLSRCTRLELSRRDLAKPFAERARQIDIELGNEERSADYYYKLVQKHKNNFRAVLQEIDLA